MNQGGTDMTGIDLDMDKAMVYNDFLTRKGTP